MITEVEHLSSLQTVTILAGGEWITCLDGLDSVEEASVTGTVSKIVLVMVLITVVSLQSGLHVVKVLMVVVSVV